ncbi:hypothetical protein LOSG293_080410 [Secundilactobacillus oryzae JCM 18671]|uniref:DUF2188 domain-containing protein n=1 Tax=Secundilactobacillus oryzae JCM 18671 TaxID=1291743 RepID=A0A081BHN7_9LACO|nr:DUF2188 domain-containing protein [Secundilactobacillus oryzae]GAK47555.1 hypothetical protein LOSG293_080410 [Secundilactobacillus oryzae JCM 18671]
MPWSMTDYPNSMKNMDNLVRKKAIDIANALVVDGYAEDRAIPIAMKQAERWFEHASTSEKTDFDEEPNPTKRDHHEKDPSKARLLDADEVVQHQEDGWAVFAKGAERASDVFETKAEAVKRAREIANNKASNVRVYRKDGTLQEIQTP